MNVNPLAPTLADSFTSEAVYEFALDTDGEAVADVVAYRVTLSPPDAGEQRSTVRRARGEEARSGNVSGEVLFQDLPVSFDEYVRVLENGDHEFFVGIRSDPFFFDLDGFQHGYEFTGEDFFIDKNVFSMVLEIPNTALGEEEIGFWFDRMERPLTNILFTEGEDKNTFNQIELGQDRRLFLEKFEAVLEARGYGSGEARAVAETVLPDDVLACDHRSAATFPDGRTRDDDIIDVTLELFTNGRVTADGVPPHQDLLSSLPRHAAPHT